MFDTKMPPGVAVLQPFSEDSSIKEISVEVKVQSPIYQASSFVCVCVRVYSSHGDSVKRTQRRDWA